MSIDCDVVVQRRAAPEDLAALGAALWGWATHAAGGAGIYQLLDNQALADLIAGKPPAESQTRGQANRRCAHVLLRDESSPDRQTTIESLRRAIPGAGLEDIVVAGKSWG
jgi:hypothetical protein